MKLATFQSGGRDRSVWSTQRLNGCSIWRLPRIAMVKAIRLRIDVGADRRRSCRADQARAVFDNNGQDETLSVDTAAAEILAPIPEPRQMRDGMSFPLHICRRRAAAQACKPRQER